MKNIINTILLLFTLSTAVSQVGINTETPQSTLDIDGSLRIRTLNQGANTDKILSRNELGNTVNVTKNQLKTAVTKQTSIYKGQFAPYIVGSDVLGTSDKIATLDLWTEQELHGSKAINDVYFLGQKQRVTLPKNITKFGDNQVRRIEFIIINNNEPEGFVSKDGANPGNGSDILFQTKQFELQSTYSGCVGAENETYLYQGTESTQLFVPRQGFSYSSENGNKKDVRLGDNRYIKDRRIVFFDFGGKWIMSNND